MTRIARPSHDDYPAFYRTYTALVPDGDILELLERQGRETAALLATVPVERETFCYGTDKWSVREVIGHCIDTERVFAFRALWMARGAAGEQPGMDQDAWVTASNAGDRPLGELAAEWETVRRDVITLLGSLPLEGFERTGVASGGRFTAGSFAWIIAGHELHHRRILVERYRLDPV